MRYLKNFESINYGDKHFGVDITNYFPWYTYPKSINDKPILNQKIFNFFKNIFPKRFQKMLTVWWCERTTIEYGPQYFIRNPHSITSGGPWITSIDDAKFGDIKTIYVDVEKEEVIYNGMTQTVDDWMDVEKIRLMSNIGKRSDSIEYINMVNDAIEIYDVYDSEITFAPGNEDQNTIGIIICNFENMDNFIDIRSWRSDDVISDILNYNGDNSFIKDLSNFYKKNKKLSYKQIEKGDSILKKEMISKSASKICLIFKHPETKMQSKISTNIHDRMVKMGYIPITSKEYKILYKP